MGSTESALLMDDTDENGRHNQDHGDQSNNSNNGAIVSNANVGVQNEQDSEDQWWWEIENENLLLDVAPSLLSEQASSLCSSVSLSENFQNRKIQNDESETAEASSIVSANVATAPSIFDESESGTNHRQHERVKENSTTTYREQTLEEFREELQSKRIARKNAIQELRTEISTLRQQLASEKETSRRLRNGETVDEHESVECVPDVAAPSASSTFSGNANIELADTQLALQSANADNISLRTEVSVVRKQVVSLKEVVACCKQMISVKDEQCMQLKNKLRQIEESLAERELKIMSDQLRQEYDRQLENIRTLRQLYEDRQRVSAAERENLERQIAIKKDELIAEQERRKDLEEGNHALKKEIENLTTELASLKEERNEYKFENKALNEEMGVVNNLFSQMLMGFNGTNNLDIDRLTEMLEENRTLLNDMATKELNCSDGATLPKLLFELVQQATISNNAAISDTDSIEMERSTMEEDSVRTKSETSMKLKTINSGEENVASAKEIIGNLPKVWKVLMELLSHHKIEQVDFKENGHSEDCYKYVETCNGQKTELSVSKTYLKLKDLILEKKSLVKETNRLKTLNCHLEYRLNEQEKRLSAVSLELTKTWHLVGKMQRQHRQLHTQEQILRYQLQQKRRLLNELKDELEYCRRKWAAARAKNDESQVQCDDLRREFAKRKLEDANINSAESGYSDCSVGPGSDEDDASRRCAATGTGGGGAAAAAAAAGGGDDDEDVDDDDGGDDSIGSAGTSRRTNEKHKTKLSEMFEHARKIKRMQSTSPGRANYRTGDILLRWNSAPPAMGCSPDDNLLIVCDNNDSLINDERAIETRVRPSTGTIPKDEGQSKRASRSSKVRCHKSTVDDGLETRSDADDDGDGDDDDTPQTSNRSKRATRIQRLEEQCKSLITQLLQTSDNRERLEVQLCRFQKEIAPVQYAIPLDEFISRKSLERFTRASSMPAVMNSDKSDNGSLTAREQEYTRKRSERLERLEEESRQLMSRIRKTSDRGNNLGSLLERIHSNKSKRHTTSRDASCESTTEEIIPQQPEQILAGYEAAAIEDGDYQSKPSPLSAEEEVYTTRRADRLKRLENESKQLLSKLSCNTNRGKLITSKLDSIHKKYGRDDDLEPVASCSKTSDSISSPTNSLPTIEKRIENMTKISINRDERLRILEEEGKQLIARLSSTAERGADIINRITEREQIRHIHQSGRQAERKTTIDDSNAPSEDSPIITTSALLPTPKTVACTSIVSEEITERVTITRVPSQIDNSQGAVPKLKSTSQLCAAKSNRFTARRESEETLEEMVNRLRNLPFPDQPKEEKDISK